MINIVSEGRDYVKILYGGGKIGFIARNPKDAKRASIIEVQAWFAKYGYKTDAQYQTLATDFNNGDKDTRKLVYYAAHYLGIDVQTVFDTIVYNQDSVDKKLTARLDEMSEHEIRMLKVDPKRMKELLDYTGATPQEATNAIDPLINQFDSYNELLTVVWKHVSSPDELNYVVNHVPDFEVCQAIADEYGISLEKTLGAIDHLRPKANQGHFLHEVFEKLDEDGLEEIIDGELDDQVAKVAEKLGVEPKFIKRRAQDWLDAIEKSSIDDSEDEEDEVDKVEAQGLQLYVFKMSTPPELGKEEEDTLVAEKDRDFINFEEDHGAWLVVSLLNTGFYYWVKTSEYDDFMNPKAPKKEEVAKDTSTKNDNKLLSLYDPYDEDSVEHQIPYSEARTNLMKDEYGRVSDEWIDVRYNFNGYRVRLSDYNEMMGIGTTTKEEPKKPTEPSMEDIDQLLLELGGDVDLDNVELQQARTINEDELSTEEDTLEEPETEHTMDLPLRVELDLGDQVLPVGTMIPILSFNDETREVTIEVLGSEVVITFAQFSEFFTETND
jgi:hypothetical protein